MNTISLTSPHIVAPKSVVQPSSVPIYIFATVLSSLSIMIGLIWDISWHTSIGRDGLFSPPHLAIYLGGIVAGLFSGYNILRITIAGNTALRSGSVKFWGVFYASLGNLFCVWGAIAMLTSAPFDDWWHNTYGLDVTILSPPHTVLLLGMITIQFGAMVSVLAHQNVGTLVNHTRTYNILFALAGGFLITMLYTIGSEYMSRHDMHGTLFYKVASFLFPMFLVAFAMSAKHRWGATAATLIYTVFLMLMAWILPLFPAAPKLGPVLNPITNFQPFDFPLLLLVPAVLIDLIIFRRKNSHAWVNAALQGAVFLISFALVQWPFANVLMASQGHWFFATERWYFGSDPDWQYRYQFAEWMESRGMELFTGMFIALAVAVASSRIGISLGRWMQQVVR